MDNSSSERRAEFAERNPSLEPRAEEEREREWFGFTEILDPYRCEPNSIAHIYFEAHISLSIKNKKEEL